MAARCSRWTPDAAACRLKNMGVRGVKNMSKLALGAAAAALVAATPALAAEASRSTFGTMPDGRSVPAVKLSNANGIETTVIALGATLQSVIMPGRDDQKADVALGYDNLDDYLNQPQYFGSTVGRFANRLAGGRFKLDGKTWQTPVSNGANALHGGTLGFDKVLWEVISVKSG